MASSPRDGLPQVNISIGLVLSGIFARSSRHRDFALA
jgi:hypothetical protein